MIGVSIFIAWSIITIYVGWKIDSFMLTLTGILVGMSGIFFTFLAMSGANILGGIAAIFFMFGIIVIIIGIVGQFDLSLREVLKGL